MMIESIEVSGAVTNRSPRDIIADLTFLQTADNIFAALDAAGFAVVPKEPTWGMKVAGLRAGYARAEPGIKRMKEGAADDGWIAAMVAAGDGAIYEAAYRAMVAVQSVPSPFTPEAPCP